MRREVISFVATPSSEEQGAKASSEGRPSRLGYGRDGHVVQKHRVIRAELGNGNKSKGMQTGRGVKVQAYFRKRLTRLTGCHR